MKRLVLFVVTAGLLLMPGAGYSAGYGNAGSRAQPLSQSLVREGDYAIKLVAALKIGTVTDETKAEDILAAKGIAPKSGWIANFPVTPTVAAEVRASVRAAAGAGRVRLGRKEADRSVTALNRKLGVGGLTAGGKRRA